MQSFGHKPVISPQSKLVFKLQNTKYQIGLTHFRKQEAVFQWWHLFEPHTRQLWSENVIA